MTNLTGYLRFSPTNNGENSNSLEIQRDIISAWALSEGHEIVAWCDDKGISGGESLDVRVGLFEALETVKNADHPSKGIVVRKLDRLARDVILQETIIRGIQKDGDVIFSTDSVESGLLAGDMGEDHTRKLVRTIIGAIGEWEKVKITQQMAYGRKLAAAQGKFAYGAPAFGHAVAPHPSGKGAQLVDVEEQLRTLARLRELRGSGLTYRQVADAANSEGLKPQRGDRWASSSVHKVLTRP